MENNLPVTHFCFCGDEISGFHEIVPKRSLEPASLFGQCQEFLKSHVSEFRNFSPDTLVPTRTLLPCHHGQHAHAGVPLVHANRNETCRGRYGKLLAFWNGGLDRKWKTEAEMEDSEFEIEKSALQGVRFRTWGHLDLGSVLFCLPFSGVKMLASEAAE